jgi:hypothetical protein
VIKIKTISGETALFLIVTALNLLPVFTGRFFVTFDGPAHLYNAQLIHSLITEKNTVLQEFFMFNSEMVPNWTGHFFLSLLGYFLPGYWAEKILLVAYLIALPLSFRSLVLSIQSKAAYVSYFIFPLTYSFVFFMGFYNFSIGLLFMFLALRFWIQLLDTNHSVQKIFILALLLTLIYFSHLVVFLISLFVMGILTLMITLKTIGTQSLKTKDFLFSFFKHLIALFMSAIVPIILMVSYFTSRSYSGTGTFIEPTELVKWLTNGRPLIALDYEKELPYTKGISFIVIGYFVIALIIRIARLFSKSDLDEKNKWFGTDSFLIAATGLLFLYFVLPDSDGVAGYVSVRLALLIYLFSILWLSTQHVRRWIGITLTFGVLCCHFLLNYFYTQESEKLARIAEECYQTAVYIEPNSVVLPLNFMQNWFLHSVTNYLGADKPMVLLDNYECANNYFPLQWNLATLPYTLLGNSTTDSYSCTKWPSHSKNHTKTIDYVFILGQLDKPSAECRNEIKQVLSQHYSLIHQSDNCSLYRLAY